MYTLLKGLFLDGRSYRRLSLRMFCQRMLDLDRGLTDKYFGLGLEGHGLGGSDVGLGVQLWPWPCVTLQGQHRYELRSYEHSICH